MCSVLHCVCHPEFHSKQPFKSKTVCLASHERHMPESDHGLLKTVVKNWLIHIQKEKYKVWVTLFSPCVSEDLPEGRGKYAVSPKQCENTHYFGRQC